MKHYKKKKKGEEYHMQIVKDETSMVNKLLLDSQLP